MRWRLLMLVQSIYRCSRKVGTTSALIVYLCAMHLALAETAQRLPAPTLDAPAAAPQLQTAVLAGGCFWGVQGVFQHVRGVRGVLAGYAGGDERSAHYHMVSEGTTGHAESVEIRFDPRAISYGELLRIFFSVVLDPTELNRQGPDVGSQYRSVIFSLDETQAAIARAYIAQLDTTRAFKRPIVTRVQPLKGFYRAEEAHQDFLINYPDSPYIAINDLPKITALKALFPEDYREQPITVRDAVVPITIDDGRTKR